MAERIHSILDLDELRGLVGDVNVSQIGVEPCVMRPCGSFADREPDLGIIYTVRSIGREAVKCYRILQLNEDGEKFSGQMREELKEICKISVDNIAGMFPEAEVFLVGTH